MIILRQKEFGSTKKSREESKERNKKDKTRKALEMAQLGTLAGGGASFAGNRILKHAAEKAEKEIKAKKVIPMEEFEKMQRKGKTAKALGIGATAALGTSLAIGAVKHARDIKKAKKENKE